MLYAIYIYIYNLQTRFAVPQLISVAWYNLDMAWQPFIPKRLSVTTACGTIAVMRTSRERKALYIYIYIYIYIKVDSHII